MKILQTASWFRRTFIATMLVAGFGLMSAFSPFLHSHEFDLAEFEENCTPCQWAQSHIDFDAQPADIAVSWFFDSSVLLLERLSLKVVTLPFSSRAPPAFL